MTNEEIIAELKWMRSNGFKNAPMVGTERCLSAFDMAITALNKLAEIEMCIDACENCITYQDIKEFSESEAYETIKKIVAK